MRDKYDDAIDYLVSYPENTYEVWKDVSQEATPDVWARAHCLFQHATPSGRFEFHGPSACGCLTQIRSGGGNFTGPFVAWTPKLTQEIRADEAIFGSIDDLQKAMTAATRDERRKLLEPFAEWQRRLDLEIRGIVNAA